MSHRWYHFSNSQTDICRLFFPSLELVDASHNSFHTVTRTNHRVPMWRLKLIRFLADRTAQSMVGSWHTIGIGIYCRLSIHPSVTLCIVTLIVRRVSRMALFIHFFRRFFCRMYRSATIHIKKSNRRYLPIRSGNGQRWHLTMATPEAAFSTVRFYIYTVRRENQRPVCNFSIWMVTDVYKKAALWQRNRTMPL